jgi:hypothetical protein
LVSLDAMFAVIADVARRADQGDEEAALQLNRLAEGCSAQWLIEAGKALRPVPVHPVVARTQQTLGEILAEALGLNADAAKADEFTFIDAAAQIIADHYSLDWLDCLTALFDLEQETLEADEFARLLQCPLGISTLGRRVAHKIVGPQADALSPLALTWQ